MSHRPSFCPLPNDKNLGSSKLKEFADDNFEFDENSRKFSKVVENIVGNGELAGEQQVLLFTQCFQKKDLYRRRVKTKPCLGKG